MTSCFRPGWTAGNLHSRMGMVNSRPTGEVR